MTQPCENLNLNLYRVFYTVAKTKSFSESSRTLHISQPAISKHIQNLEYELNTLLFYRTNRGIELTPEAKKLLVYVEKAYNYLVLGERELQEGKEQTQGKLFIGISPYISSYYLNDKIKKYMKEYPNITLNLSTHSDSYLFELLNQHSLDLLVIPGEYKEFKNFKVEKLFDVEYSFAYKKEKFTIEETNLQEIFNKYPILLPPKASRLRVALEKKLTELNITSNPIMELETTGMMTTFIKEGTGIGYIPNKVAIKEGFNLINIDTELPTTTISLIYDEDAITNSSRTFIDTIKEDKK